MIQSLNMTRMFEIPYSIHNMGLHWKIPIKDNMIDFYPTTHSFYDPDTKVKGKGIKSFLEYIGKTEPN